MTDSIPARLLEQAKLRPHAPAYHVREGGIWKATSWKGYSDAVVRFGRALIATGFEPDQKICILGFNRPEWVIADLAAMGAGGAPAGIYATCSAEEVQYITDHTEAPLIVVENEEQWKKVQEQRENLPRLKLVVTMLGAPSIDDEMVLSWEAFMAKADEVEEQLYFDRVEALEPDALATLIYTSGTTGPPKGVMLSHHNLVWTADKAIDICGLASDDCMLSYLPLSHIAEQMFSIHGPITGGARIYFAESIDDVPENLKEVQPTIFFGVPRIWEKFHAGITAKLKDASGVKAKLVKWAMKVGHEAAQKKGRGQSHASFQYNLANKLIYSKLKPAVGMGRARVCVSGAAPISKEVLEFFAGLDINVLEVYGQSEDTGPTTFNLPNRFKVGTVGPAVEGVTVKIAEDGEILVQGPNVFLGYYKDADATNETLVDGWLHSGDLGEINDGFLSITGRKKDIIITAGGKNVAPKNIEGALKNHELINEAVVIGDRRKYLSALITLDPDASAAWASAHGKDLATLHDDPELLAELQRCVEGVNSQFARVEQLKKFKVLERNFTVEDGELTPTLKVKRKLVNEHFADQIESMYG